MKGDEGVGCLGSPVVKTTEVSGYFLKERGGHRLKASLSSDIRLKFPPELSG